MLTYRQKLGGFSHKCTTMVFWSYVTHPIPNEVNKVLCTSLGTYVLQIEAEYFLKLLLYFHSSQKCALKVLYLKSRLPGPPFRKTLPQKVESTNKLAWAAVCCMSFSIQLTYLWCHRYKASCLVKAAGIGSLRGQGKFGVTWKACLSGRRQESWRR